MPTHIDGTFHLNAPWFEHYVLVDNMDLGEPITTKEGITCPICEYPEAVQLSRYNLYYPMMFWCSVCENVWNRMVCKCPDCGGDMWTGGKLNKEQAGPGQLICSRCLMVFDQEFIEEWNSGEIEYEEEE